MIACNLFGLGVSQEVCWAVWIVVYALLIAFLTANASCRVCLLRKRGA